MPSVSIRRALVAALLLTVAALTGTGAAAASAASAAQPFCGITWGSLSRSHDAPGGAALTDVRTGQHACYDRVVFQFAGPATGYRVAYADSVVSEARGTPLQVAGGARLAVELQAPAYDVETGAPSFPHAAGDHVAAVSGYRTLRDVVYGGSFEGSTTFGVGVRARLPFRVFTLAGPGSSSRIVIDVAHRWS